MLSTAQQGTPRWMAASVQKAENKQMCSLWWECLDSLASYEILVQNGLRSYNLLIFSHVDASSKNLLAKEIFKFQINFSYNRQYLFYWYSMNIYPESET